MWPNALSTKLPDHHAPVFCLGTCKRAGPGADLGDVAGKQAAQSFAAQHLARGVRQWHHMHDLHQLQRLGVVAQGASGMYLKAVQPTKVDSRHSQTLTPKAAFTLWSHTLSSAATFVMF